MPYLFIDIQIPIHFYLSTVTHTLRFGHPDIKRVHRPGPGLLSPASWHAERDDELSLAHFSITTWALVMGE